MAPKVHRSGEVLTRTEWNFALIVGGTVSLLWGAGFAAVVWGLHQGRFDYDPLGWLGVAGVVGGLLLLLYREGLTIDRGRGEVIRWHGLLVPLVRLSRRTQEFERVIVIDPDSRSRSVVDDFAEVWLEGPDEKLKASLGTAENYEDARDWAENLASLLDLKLVDSLAGGGVEVESSKITLPFGRRNAQVDLPSVAPPWEGMEARLTHQENRLQVQIPAKPRDPNIYLPLIIFVLFIALVSITGGTSMTKASFFLGFLTPLGWAVWLIIGYGLWRSRLRETMITAAPEGLQVELRFFGKRLYALVLKDSEIRELSSRKSSLVIWTGSKLHQFPLGVEKGEAAFVVDQVKRAIIGSSRDRDVEPGEQEE